jgi:hypothetical protein
MKFLKVLLALLGIAAVIGAAVLLGQFALDSRELIGAAQRYDGGRVIRDPFVTTSMLTGIGAAAGLLLGLAIGLPARTRGQIRRDTLDEVNRDRNAAIANRAAERTAIPEGPEAQA